MQMAISEEQTVKKWWLTYKQLKQTQNVQVNLAVSFIGAEYLLRYGTHTLSREAG